MENGNNNEIINNIRKQKIKEIYEYAYEFFNDDSKDIIHISLNSSKNRNYVYSILSDKDRSFLNDCTVNDVYDELSKVMNNNELYNGVLSVILMKSTKFRLNELCWNLMSKEYYHLFDGIDSLNDINNINYHKISIPGEIARFCLYNEDDIESYIYLNIEEMNIDNVKIDLGEFIDDDLDIKYSYLTSPYNEDIFLMGSDLFIKFNLYGYSSLRESTRIIRILEDFFDVKNITYKEESLKFALDMISVKFLIKAIYSKSLCYDNDKFNISLSLSGKDLKPLFKKLNLTEYIDCGNLSINLNINNNCRYTLGESIENLMVVSYYKKTEGNVINYKKRIYFGSDEDIDMTVSELHNLLKLPSCEKDDYDTNFIMNTTISNNYEENNTTVSSDKILKENKPEISVDDILEEYLELDEEVKKYKESIDEEEREDTMEINDSYFYMYNNTIAIYDLDKKFKKWYSKVINKYYRIDLCFTDNMHNVTIVSTNEIPLKKIIKGLKNLICKEEDILLSDENILKILVHFNKISEDMLKKYLTTMKLDKLNKRKVD